ncbi:hypothetical protein ACFL16_03055 [Patescibacteria group bacterium]
MNIFEKPSVSASEKEKPLYMERIATRADRDIERIKAISEGRMETLNLSPEEKVELENFEGELSERSKGVMKGAVVANFYLDYFVTEKGKDDLRDLFGEDEFGDSAEEIKNYLLENRRKIKNNAEFKRIQKKSLEFSKKEVKDILVENMDEEGNIDVSLAKNPERVQILLNPKNVSEKLDKLRNLRREFKKEISEMEDNDSDLDKAKVKLLEIYKRRFNQIIAQQFNSAANVKRLSENVGVEELTPEERKITDSFNGLESLQKNYARFDKFVFGASSEEFDENGWRPQVGEEFRGLIEELGSQYVEQESRKYDLVRAKGLDPEKVFEENQDIHEFAEFGEEILESYGVKSEHPADMYDPDRKAPAPDGKWQFVVMDYFKKTEVNRKEKVVRVNTIKRSIHNIITVVLGHEIGHVVQSLNSPKLPFKILQGTLKAGRAVAFSEGGAKVLEDEISTKAFGIHAPSKVNYANAMLERLDGGDYLDCAKAAYEWERRAIMEQVKNGVISREKAEELFKKKVGVALNSAKRLFYGGNDLSDKSGFLTRSWDTSYLEGQVVAEKLKKADLEKLAFVPGLNLQALADFMEIGQIKLDDIQNPNLHVLKIWDRIKEDYQIKE